MPKACRSCGLERQKHHFMKSEWKRPAGEGRCKGCMEQSQAAGSITNARRSATTPRGPESMSRAELMSPAGQEAVFQGLLRKAKAAGVHPLHYHAHMDEQRRQQAMLAEVPARDRCTVSELPVYVTVECWLQAADGTSLAPLADHALRTVCRFLTKAEIAACLDIKAIPYDSSYGFHADADHYGDDRGDRLNTNAHMDECESPEVRKTLEASQMSRLGGVLFKKLNPFIVNNGGLLMAATNGTLDPQAPVCLADVMGGLMLLVDAFIADEKCGHQDLAAAFLPIAEDLGQFAEFQPWMMVVVPPPDAGMAVWPIEADCSDSYNPNDSPGTKLDTRIVFDLAYLGVMMGAFPMDGPRQPDDAKREALRFAREVCETTRRQTQRPQLRGRLLSLQSFMKLMAGDSCGASADLDASLAAHPDQGVRHTKILFEMQKTMKICTIAKTKQTRQDLLDWIDASHPDDRQLRLSCAAVSTLYLLEGTEEAVKLGREWYERSSVAFERRDYLWGQPPNGGWARVEAPTRLEGGLLQIAHDAFNIDLSKLEAQSANELRRKYETWGSYLPPALVSKLVAQIAELRKSSGSAPSRPAFELGEAVFYTPGGSKGSLGTIRSLPTDNSDPVYGVMIRGDVGDSIWKVSGSDLKSRRSVEEDVERCPCCFEELVLEPVTLSCNHEFCVPCLHPTGFMAEKADAPAPLTICPMCRAPINDADVAYIRAAVEELPEKRVKRLEKSRYKELIPQSKPLLDEISSKLDALRISGLRGQALRAQEEPLWSQIRAEQERVRNVVSRELNNEAVFGGLKDGETPKQNWRRIIGKVTDLELNDQAPNGDGDQAYIGDGGPGSGAHQLRVAWTEGMDFHEVVRAPPASESASLTGTAHVEQLIWEFLSACHAGSFKAVERFVSEMKLAEVDGDAGELGLTLLERRFSLMRFTPIMAALSGQRFLSLRDATTGERLPNNEIGTDYTRVVKVLLNAGASVDARDVLGCTALFHCCSVTATPVTLEIARLLHSRGANPDAPNRLGSTALHSAVICKRADVFATLLALGANADAKDDTGLTAARLAKLLAATGNTEFMQLLKGKGNAGHAMMPSTGSDIDSSQKDKKGGAKSIARLCSNPSCGAAGAKLRCKGCKRVVYCNRRCQTTHWTQGGHKRHCTPVLTKEGAAAAATTAASAAPAVTRSAPSTYLGEPIP